MSAIAFNPELVRNARIQLRRGRMLAAAVICAAVSLSLVASYKLSTTGARDLFTTIFLIQTAVLVIGGGIYCLQSVQREKDLNTFDFQRITRLTPLELAVGKILGAPALVYFVALCLMPVALCAAVYSGARLTTVVQMYAILALGAVAYHSFAVLISMVLERGTAAGGMLFYLGAVGMTSIDIGSEQGGPLAFHALSPFWAYDLILPEGESWRGVPDSPYALPAHTDFFFGSSVSHSGVLMALYVTLAAWFLLAVVRNIKRDPSVYEIYRPAQGVALALYLNFLVLAFFQWMIGNYRYDSGAQSGFWEFRPISATDAENTFLGFSLVIFMFLGLALLRNRDRVRRQLREIGSTAAGWWAAIWPVPFLASGVALAGAAIIGMIQSKLQPQAAWSVELGILQVALVAAWLSRDFLYLQWMNVRRARRPLVTGALYLIIFYLCAGVVLGALELFDPKASSAAAIFIPSAVFGLDSPTWLAQRGPWMGALALLLGQAVVFAWLHRRELQGLAAATPSTETVRTEAVG